MPITLPHSTAISSPITSRPLKLSAIAPHCRLGEATAQPNTLFPANLLIPHKLALCTPILRVSHIGYIVEDTAEQIDRFRGVKEGLALVGDDCEEVGCFRSFGTAVLHELTHNLIDLG